ncbi:response regulator transcription factor [Cellulomonas triticagri]
MPCPVRAGPGCRWAPEVFFRPSSSSRRGRSGGQRMIVCHDDVDEVIVRHVGQGMTNREIGRAIYLSEHTVAHRITRLLRRSGLRNRVQIGAVAATAGTTTTPPDCPGHPCC